MTVKRDGYKRDDDLSQKKINSDLVNSSGVNVDQDIEPVQLRWNNINVKAGSNVIVENLSGSVLPGKITGLIGPSGCGKTTLISCLTNTIESGLTAEGQIFLNDTEARGTMLQDYVSLVTSETEVYDNLSMYDQVLFAASLRYDNPEKEAINIIDKMGMYEHKDKPASVLSGGQKLRCQIGCCFALKTPIIILDEPTTGLDSTTTDKMFGFISITAVGGKTVLLSIHQPSPVILDSLESLIVMTAFGNVCFQGSIEEARTHFTKIGFPKTIEYLNDADHYIRIVSAQLEYGGGYNEDARNRLNHLSKSWKHRKYPCLVSTKLKPCSINSIAIMKGRLLAKGKNDRKSNIIFNFLGKCFLPAYIASTYSYMKNISLYAYHTNAYVNPSSVFLKFFMLLFTFTRVFVYLGYQLGSISTKKPIYLQNVKEKTTTEILNWQNKQFLEKICLSDGDKKGFKRCCEEIVEQRTKFLQNIEFTANARGFCKTISKNYLVGWVKKDFPMMFGELALSEKKMEAIKKESEELFEKINNDNWFPIIKEFLHKSTSPTLNEKFDFFGNGTCNLDISASCILDFMQYELDSLLMSELDEKLDLQNDVPKKNAIIFGVKTCGFPHAMTVYSYLKKYKNVLLKDKDGDKKKVIQEKYTFLNFDRNFDDILLMDSNYLFKDLFDDGYLIFMGLYFFLRFSCLFYSSADFTSYMTFHKKEYSQNYFSSFGFIISALSFNFVSIASIIITDLIFMISLFYDKPNFIVILGIYLIMHVFFFCLNLIFTLVISDNISMLTNITQFCIRVIILVLFFINPDALLAFKNGIFATASLALFLAIPLMLTPVFLIELLKNGSKISIRECFVQGLSLKTSFYYLGKLGLITLVTSILTWFIVVWKLSYGYTKLNFLDIDGSSSISKKKKIRVQVENGL